MPLVVIVDIKTLVDKPLALSPPLLRTRAYWEQTLIFATQTLRFVITFANVRIISEYANDFFIIL